MLIPGDRSGLDLSSRLIFLSMNPRLRAFPPEGSERGANLSDVGRSESEFDHSFAEEEEAREALDLESSEPIRVVSRAGRFLLLECGEPEGQAVPLDRDLVLGGDVRAFPLADLLSLIHGAGKSGFLLFQHANEEKAIFLHRGEVVFAVSNLPSDRLGRCLLRQGMIEKADLEFAEDRYNPMTRFGKILVEAGILNARELWNGVRIQVEEIVRSLFSYSAGWIHFWEGEVEPNNVVRLTLPTNRLIAEGIEQRDALLRFLARLEDGRTQIRRGSETRLPSSENERAIIHSLDGPVSFAAVCHRAGLDPRTAARTLNFLQLTGHVVIDHDAMPGAPDYTTADDDVVREAVTLHLKLIFELTAPLVALDGADAVSERLNRILEESTPRGTRVLEGVSFNEACALDPEDLTHRALRQPGDRVRGVDEALGELVAYLEFELKNHPRIEDCSTFLEAVEPLRAMLIR